MKIIYRNGKDVQLNINIRLHFPASITDEELKWMEQSIKTIVANDAVMLWKKVIQERRSN